MIELLNIFFIFFSIFVFLTGGILNIFNKKGISIISIDNLSPNLILLLSFVLLRSLILKKEFFFYFSL